MQKIIDKILLKLGPKIRLATPLGIGKPNYFINALYQRVKQDPRLHLQIHTALSLNPPRLKTQLEKNLLQPFYERHFGLDYPRLEYADDLKSGNLPQNIEVFEFYMQSGQYIGNSTAQESYVSLNYTHVAQDIFEKEIQILPVLVAKKGAQYSLSCNPDLTLDVFDLYQKNNKKLYIVGVVHKDLAFLGEDAIVESDFFDWVIEDSPHHELFAIPQLPNEDADYMIGLHASRWVKDEGSLQIGIGSLSDSLVYAILLRHQKNAEYQKLLQKWNADTSTEDLLPFQKGLYGTSEMVMDGFMYLRKAGILIRQVFNKDKTKSYYLHGAFYLGTKKLYAWLRDLNKEDFSGLSMTRVSKVNDLYDEDENLLRRQRKNARFFNTCMQVSLLGGAASETLENGQVVSGVGGQYNFVAMSHELPDSRSILMLRSVREKNGKRSSNIVSSHGHLTIPRHLRDIVVTEYGVADLRGKTDAQCISALIEIADAEFQEQLVKMAQKNGKLPLNYKIPVRARQNHPDFIRKYLSDAKKQALFPDFPFGSDFSLVEEKLILALLRLKKISHSPFKILKLFISGCWLSKEPHREELERMHLYNPRSLKDKIYQKLILRLLVSE